MSMVLVGCSVETETRVSIDLDTVRAGTFMPAGERHWKVIVDPNVTPAELVLVREAMADWAGNVICPMTFEVGYGETPRDWRAPRFHDPRIIQVWTVDGYEDHHVVGQEYENPGWSTFVTFKRPTDGEEADHLPAVIRHELGHAFGIDHLPPPSIMQSKGVTALRVTGADAAEYDWRWCRPTW
jgi:hypothetical protein